ncbi:transposase [Singulisphaera acidiphila]|uniref:transposase n=1 Tax=Singulisphaera acidiphila TaxID=466153 RepID=UPI0002470C44|nr:transposase [Singulisphaera acidiphila]
MAQSPGSSATRGTVNILNFLVAHSGMMERVCLEANDSDHDVPALKQFRRNHHWLRGIYLIHDGGPSHTEQITKDYLAACDGWWRLCLTPARASWLDQVELLTHAFGLRCLKRGSWSSREDYIAHVMPSWLD